MFSCPFSRYRHIKLPLGEASAGDMFQKRIDELCRDLQNVFDVADDISIAGFNEEDRGHDETLHKVPSGYPGRQT